MSADLLPVIYPMISQPLPDPRLRVISDGMGVQSFAMKMMASRGLIGPMPDASIFSNTGDETTASLETRDMLLSGNWAVPFPQIECSSGNLADDFDLATAGMLDRFPNPPLFTKDQNGKRGQLTRSCTRDYKIVAVRRKIRELLGAGIRERIAPGSVELWIGITTDEKHRFAASEVAHITNRAPLLEIGWSRQNCIDWIWDEYQIAIPADRETYSACTHFPGWLAMKRDYPADFAVAVAADKAARHGMPGVREAAYLSDRLEPLDEIDFEAAILARRGGLFPVSDGCNAAGGCRT